jgi:hypothetical protein
MAFDYRKWRAAIEAPTLVIEQGGPAICTEAALPKIAASISLLVREPFYMT